MSEANTKPIDAQYYKLLEELQMVDFGLLELSLYLNTHPNDMKAIQQLNQWSEQRHKIAQQYELDYGPLLQFGHSYSKFPWQWIESPWPWQV
ncbi:spore coat protein CotJB [Paenibacillus selenitireducens]|uniref:Spore coat protein CotJB n=1 Tax=Paenibacillus selenitireducens TaxID=1324314 RepID=A0A1T2XLT7_9BACL|nr:spore coat protein CotJB [Paenibacillus selenitireducens]OPA80834.1 spore coat protein CotJB [Paenibacillus selenitireducens]